ncbi:hypothetical protein [Streptomyces sp. CBMA152]|uniref:hypothetical protein n=1 Tax=Streptomyces sp. CBMA152 TaxID=1896312 RepID=UPI001CB6B9EF|nr:hypothetical protein [Streptomyces sp. CBMA152]
MSRSDRPVGAQAAVDRCDAAFVAGDVDTAVGEFTTVLRRTTPADRERLIANMVKALQDRRPDTTARPQTRALFPVSVAAGRSREPRPWCVPAIPWKALLRGRWRPG